MSTDCDKAVACMYDCYEAATKGRPATDVADIANAMIPHIEDPHYRRVIEAGKGTLEGMASQPTNVVPFANFQKG